MPPPTPHPLKTFLRHCGWGVGAVCAVTLAAGAMAQTPRSDGPELDQPPVCSKRPVPPALKGVCEITEFTQLGKKRRRVKVILTAETADIDVAGYRVKTENYNRKYLPPIIEANAGDAVAARLINKLKSRDMLASGEKPAPPKLGPAVHHHAAAQPKGNPTNLHFFHGGIVTPRNDRERYGQDAAGAPGAPKGDNVYVVLPSGGAPIDYDVPIPGEGELDGGVLDAPGTTIAHPAGLNWYHSHLHGISSGQILGGLSGLLSVGEATANVRAKCPASTSAADCKRLTDELKKRTKVRYAVVRDILLKGITAHPEDASQAGKAKERAEWVWDQKDFRGECNVYDKDGSENKDKRLRKGYCQPDGRDSAWLFTLNGQRFPTITVESGRNLLLRLGNLSANVTYWLELYNERDENDRLPLSVLSLDGVVPADPVPHDQAGKIDALKVQDLVLMPASRAEIYLHNDAPRDSEKVYILGAKELDTRTTDKWPAIQLARVKLKAGKGAPKIDVALNTPIRKPLFHRHAAARMAEAEMPKGCVRDVKEGEHRRVTFLGNSSNGWKIKTEIMMPPPDGSGPFNENQFKPDENETVGESSGWSFDKYENQDGTIDWSKPHVCIRLDNRSRETSTGYQQLWVLSNNTATLHNFHIHQMKFRLATKKELMAAEGRYRMIPREERSSTCPDNDCDNRPDLKPDYKLYEEGTSEPQSTWHDTIPVPAGKRVYVMMSFTAKEQIGRYVFHCHILKHEDNGLMAPIEVWARFPGMIGR